MPLTNINLLQQHLKKQQVKKVIHRIHFSLVYVFALAGVFFLGSFALSYYHLTNVRGGVDAQNYQFLGPSVLGESTTTASSSLRSLSDLQNTISQLTASELIKKRNFCQIIALNAVVGDNAQKIVAAYQGGATDSQVQQMVQAVRIQLANHDDSMQATDDACENIAASAQVLDVSQGILDSNNTVNAFVWTQDDTWPTLRSAIVKDAPVINQVAAQTGVDPRMVVAAMFAEQERLMHTDRGLFKQYLQPLKILASENQFSLGVMGIKPNTAKAVEQNLTDAKSPFYIGDNYTSLLNFTTADPDSERYNRLTDNKNHYYSYLYGALYIKQLEQQWQNTGYPIADRPEIVGTLYNIGFEHSSPNPLPAVGGATISIDGMKYTYGSLVYEFYYSGELLNVFPMQAGSL